MACARQQLGPVRARELESTGDLAQVLVPPAREPLAITSAKRASQLPDVPTVAEAGVPKFEFSLWFGLWGPNGIPLPIVTKSRKDFGTALADNAVREKLGSLGNEVMLMTPAQFRKMLEDQIADTARIFKAAGIKPQ